MASKALKAGIGYTVGNYLIKGISFLTVPLFARLLSPSDYGIFNTYLAYESVFYLFVGLALHTCLKNAKYKYEAEFQKFSSSCLLLVCIVFAAWIFVVNILFPFINRLTDFPRWLVNVLIFHCFASSLLIFYNSYISLDYAYKSYLAVSAVNAVGNVAISVLLILFVFPSSRYVGRILGTVLVLVPITVYIIFYFWKKAKPKVNKKYWHFALKFSLPLVPHGLSQVILSQFDRIMITRMIGAAESGIYSFAYTIFSIVQITGFSIDSAWTPWFYQQMHDKNYDGIKKRSSFVIISMSAFMSIVMLISPELLSLLGTKSYADSVYCVIPLVAGGFFAFIYNFPAGIEYYFEKTKFIMAGTMAAALLNIVLNYIFIKQYGYVAAAYTTLATYFLYFVFHWFLSRKIFRERIYSIKAVVMSSLSVFIVTAICILFLKVTVVRMMVAAGAIAVFVVYEEKEMGIGKKILNRK